jgi:hypothetical protein
MVVATFALRSAGFALASACASIGAAGPWHMLCTLRRSNELEGLMTFSAVRTSSHPVEQGEARHRTSLFKEDRPRKIDQFISFFGDGDRDTNDSAGDSTLDSFGDRWSER